MQNRTSSGGRSEAGNLQPAGRPASQRRNRNADRPLPSFGDRSRAKLGSLWCGSMRAKGKVGAQVRSISLEGSRILPGKFTGQRVSREGSEPAGCHFGGVRSSGPCRPVMPGEQTGGNLRSILWQAELAAQGATQRAARGAPELMTVAAAGLWSDAATLVLSGSF